jgi:early secretory antigenic target protein ESAT-6
MSVAPSILVRFQNVVQASTNAKTTAADMNDSLSQLKSDLANLKSIWEGPAAGDYKELQRQWDQALTDLNQILSEISTTLQQAADQYQQTEKSNQSAWQV